MKKIRLSILAFALPFVMSAQTAMNFDGVDDAVITNTPGITGSASRTVEAWILTSKDSQPVSQGGSDQSVIVDWGNTYSGSRFTFNILWNNAIRLESAGQGVSGTIPVNDSVWHHVAVVYDNSSSTEKVKLYVDGVLDVVGNITNIYTSATNNIRIGMRIDNVKPFQGSIDEVRVWNYARTQEEIQATMNQEFCTIPSSLVAYYDFEEGVPGADNSAITTIENSVTGAQEGSLTNFDLTTSTSNFDNGVTLQSGFSTSQTLTLCAGDSLVIGGNTYKTTGNYNDLVTSLVTGCDSAVATDLTVLAPIATTQSFTECEGFNVTVGTNTYDENGTYTDVFPSVDGCDSTVTTILDIRDFPILSTVTVGTTIVSNQNGASYQWLDCNNGDAEITGETGQTFYTNANGSFSVIVDNGVCPADTSTCVSIVNVGVEEELANSIDLYPNPVSSVLNISLEQITGSVSVTIVNVLGEVVHQTSINTTTFTSINLSHLNQGSYFVTFKTEEATVTKKNH